MVYNFNTYSNLLAELMPGVFSIVLIVTLSRPTQKKFYEQVLNLLNDADVMFI